MAGMQRQHECCGMMPVPGHLPSQVVRASASHAGGDRDCAAAAAFNFNLSLLILGCVGWSVLCCESPEVQSSHWQRPTLKAYITSSVRAHAV